MAEHVNPKLRTYVLREKKIIDPRMIQNDKGGYVAPEGVTLEHPIKEGNLFIAQESGNMYFDLEDCRIQISPTWMTLEDDNSTGTGGEGGGLGG